jgi:hypothetical protein
MPWLFGFSTSAGMGWRMGLSMWVWRSRGKYVDLKLTRNWGILSFNLESLASQKDWLLKWYASDYNSITWDPSTPQTIVTIIFWKSIWWSIQSSTASLPKSHIIPVNRTNDTKTRLLWTLSENFFVLRTEDSKSPTLLCESL